MSAFTYPALTNSQISALPAEGRRKHGTIGRVVATLRHWRRLSREKRALADLSPRDLADFGASSADVYRELNTPVWRYPLI